MTGAPITLILILSIVATSLWGFSHRNAFQDFGLNAWQVVKHHQWYRLVTHAFLHADLNHLFFNLFTFFFFGTQIEMFFGAIFGNLGWLWFLGLFASGIIAATIPDLIYQRRNKQFNSIGASGGVAALVFASIAVDHTLPICLYAVLCLPGGIWGIIYLAYSFYQDSQPQNKSNINFKAHIAGALWGFAFIMFLRFFLF